MVTLFDRFRAEGKTIIDINDNAERMITEKEKHELSGGKYGVAFIPTMRTWVLWKADEK